jgi:hypothetical protein
MKATAESTPDDRPLQARFTGRIFAQTGQDIKVDGLLATSTGEPETGQSVLVNNVEQVNSRTGAGNRASPLPIPHRDARAPKSDNQKHRKFKEFVLAHAARTNAR